MITIINEAGRELKLGISDVHGLIDLLKAGGSQFGKSAKVSAEKIRTNANMESSLSAQHDWADQMDTVDLADDVCEFIQQAPNVRPPADPKDI